MTTIGQVQQRPTTSTRNYTTAAVAGAATGALSRYIIPTKEEFTGMINKQNVDKFVSTAATKARGNSHSILKFTALGALVGVAIKSITNALNKPKKEAQDVFEYTDLGAVIDAQADACAVMLLYN